MAQGGNPAVADHPERLPKPKHTVPVLAPRAGVVAGLDARSIGLAAVKLGAGRRKVGEKIDLAAGFLLKKKVGSGVKRGEPLGMVLGSDLGRVRQAARLLLATYRFSTGPVRPSRLLLGRLAG